MPARWIAFFRFHGLLLPPLTDPTAPPTLLLRDGAVWDADRAARAHGIRPGLSAAAARTLCPAAVGHTFDPATAVGLLAPAWDLLATASSVVEPERTGRPEAWAAWPATSPPLPELRALLAEVGRALPQVDIAVGLSTNRMLACAACPPAGGFAAVAPGGEARFLAMRPLQLLVDQGLLAPALHRRLAALGLRRCGQVVALPEAALLARLGPEGRRLRALCLGEDGRPVAALHPPRRISARQTFPGGLPPEAWPRAAARLAEKAVADLGPAEGARQLVLRGAHDEVHRTWRAPRRAAGILARAAAELAHRAAAGREEPTDHLEVCLAELAVIPSTPISLLPLSPGERLRLPSVGRRKRTAALDPPVGAHQELDDLLARLPSGILRRGPGAADRYERLLSLLDPWRAAQ